MVGMYINKEVAGMTHVITSIPGKFNVNVECGIEEWSRERELEDRRLYLYGEILGIDEEDKCMYMSVSMTSKIVERIFDFNRLDEGIPIEDREPIRLYINSPGGDVEEGFALLSAIELSKTPVYTINVGQWSSMAFLIGITGHKRLSLPYMTFLMHEGFSFAGGAASKVKDRMDFEERFNNEVVKRHILKYGTISESEYDDNIRKEFYMLPEDALAYGFIDEIVKDIDTVL